MDPLMCVEYRKLHTNEGEVRLLVLQPRLDPGHPIRCSLEHVNVYDGISYVALSYLWGDEKDVEPIVVDDKPIVVDDRPFMATRNLVTALRGLERLGVERVWADAICINQKDEDEKSQQIPKIGIIYREATSVKAWLPGVRRDAADPLAILRCRKSYGETTKESVMAARRFFDNPYLRRLWVFQELVLGNNVCFVHGDHSIELENLKASMDKGETEPILSARLASSNEDQYLLRNSPGFRHVKNILDLRPRLEAGQSLDLVEALCLASASQSREISDRVFGLWGLAHNIELYLPAAAYGIPCRQLSLNMTKAHIRMKHSLDIIAILGNKTNENDTPSWLPDWFSGDLWSTPRASYLAPSSTLRKKKISRHLMPTFDSPFTTESVQVWSGQKWDIWCAHGHIAPEYKILNDKILQAKGLFLGQISGCSGTVSENSTSFAGPVYQETPSLKKWSKKLMALRDLLLLDFNSPVPNTMQLARFHAVCVRYMGASARGKSEPKQDFPHLRRWLARQSSFQVFGQSLASLLSFKTKSLLGNYLASYGWFQTLASMPSPKQASPEWFEPARMQCALELGMRLAHGDFGLGWVDEKARPGDRVALLLGCSVPVVLRMRGQGEYVLVGDAIVHGAMRGERIVEADCEFLNIC